MRPDRRLVALAVLALAIFAPTFSHADTERTRPIDGLLREVNMQRELNGAGPLRLNKRLSAAAQKYAEDMAKRDFFDHRSPDGRGYQERITSEGYQWRAIAENLGAGLSSGRNDLVRRLHCQNNCEKIASPARQACLSEVSGSASGHRNQVRCSQGHPP